MMKTRRRLFAGVVLAIGFTSIYKAKAIQRTPKRQGANVINFERDEWGIVILTRRQIELRNRSKMAHRSAFKIHRTAESSNNILADGFLAEIRLPSGERNC